MREIKFRAWHDGNKRFEYFTIKDLWENGFRVGENMQWNPPGRVTPRSGYIPEKELKDWSDNAFLPNADLQQYTGLKDKNGREIYEGDILTDPYGPEGAATGTVENINGDTIIKFIPGTIPEDWAHEYYPVLGGSGEYTVIGNIYENPELLSARDQ
jgi:hypothetical protein